MELPAIHESTLRALALGQLKLSPDVAAFRSIDELGHELSERLEEESGLHGFSMSDFWFNVKREFKVLVCTDDARYKDLREKLESAKDKAETVSIVVIAGAIATYVGLAAGALTGLCALCLLALARVGKEAFCRSVKIDVPFGE